MEIYRIAQLNSNELSSWIANLVDSKYGGSEKANEGWCGQVSGDIYKYLMERGESPEIWSIVAWYDYTGQPDVIENPTIEEHQDVLEQLTGIFNHSFVKWDGRYWDGVGENNLQSMLDQHAWGDLGNGVSIMREHK